MKKNLTDDQLRAKVREALGITSAYALETIYSMSRERFEGMLAILEEHPPRNPSPQSPVAQGVPSVDDLYEAIRIYEVEASRLAYETGRLTESKKKALEIAHAHLITSHRAPSYHRPMVPSNCVGCVHCYRDECSDWQGTLPTDMCKDKVVVKRVSNPTFAKPVPLEFVPEDRVPSGGGSSDWPERKSPDFYAGYYEGVKSQQAINESAATESQDDGVREAMETVKRIAYGGQCAHEETHRGGAIWTICDECGAKWADDEGGFKPNADIPRLDAAFDVIDKAIIKGKL